MQGVEHRTGNVPVEVVGLQVQGVGVGEQAGQAFGDGGAVLLVDTDIDFHGSLLSRLVRLIVMPENVEDL